MNENNRFLRLVRRGFRLNDEDNEGGFFSIVTKQVTIYVVFNNQK